MKITSLEIKQHEFEKSFRGYNIEEVNHFLSNISQEWERMLNELKMLKMQLEISEKEASKLREVEMTLIKTLRTAEDTSSRITDTANQEANRKIQDAEQKVGAILADAENTAQTLIEEAQQKAFEIQNSAKLEFSSLEKQFSGLEMQKAELLNQLKQIAFDATQIVAQNQIAPLEKTVIETEEEELVKAEPTELVVEPLFETSVEPETIEDLPAPDAQLEEETITEEEEEENHGLSFSSAVNDISLETSDDKTNLEIIEGIGPKIKELLNKAHIISFRDLVNTHCTELEIFWMPVVLSLLPMTRAHGLSKPNLPIKVNGKSWKS
ncbi:MAG: DivIVA domain-containing protein [Cytophagaceae bacterium]|nr:DivIVA domain-containing protein [Cytophagaceae bacterium]